MTKKVFYNASLPRSGSTLLQNVLAQNPEIYTSPTSGLFDIVTGTKTIYTNSTEFVAQDQSVTIDGYRSLVKGAMYGYYNGMTDKPYSIDKNRGWIGEYKFIEAFDPDAKIICMVRDLRSIYSSIEKKYRKNPLLDHEITNWHELRGITTYKRVIELSTSRLISTSTESIYQAILEGYDSKILFIKYEDFCVDPFTYLKKIYTYLELPYFEHDIINVQQVTHENDQLYGSFADHIIKPTIAPVQEDYSHILGFEVCKLITDMYDWYYHHFDYK
jgi:sulfotransferase